MASVRLDDVFPQHPKVMMVGQEAAWLYVCGLCYCGRYLTDGFIPARALSTFMDIEEGEAHAKQLASRLVGAGLWSASDGGYTVHDYHDYYAVI